MAKDDGADPNRLVRRQAGTYRTADERFEVRQAATGWYLVDSQTTDELGQELVRGPFRTLDGIREALPEARRTTLRSVPPPRGSSGRGSAPAPSKARRRPKAAPPPPSWIDQLPKREAATTRALIRALEREGLPDAEELVRSERRGSKPILATRLVERRLEALIADLPEDERDDALRLVRRVVKILSGDGAAVPAPLPGWALVEVDAAEEAPARRIVPRAGASGRSGRGAR